MQKCNFRWFDRGYHYECGEPLGHGPRHVSPEGIPHVDNVTYCPDCNHDHHAEIAQLRQDLAELRRSLRDTRGDMRGSDADPKQKSCSQCGRRFTAQPCGPIHAAIQMARRDTRGAK